MTKYERSHPFPEFIHTPPMNFKKEGSSGAW